MSESLVKKNFKSLVVGFVFVILLIVLGYQAWIIRGQGYEITTLRFSNMANLNDIETLRLKVLDLSAGDKPGADLSFEDWLFLSRTKELKEQEQNFWGDSFVDKVLGESHIPEYRKYVRWIEKNRYYDDDYGYIHINDDYYENSKKSIVYADEMIISYKFDYSYYSGGAHDSRYIFTGTINRNPYWKKCPHLLLSDIVSKDDMQKMTSLLLESFKKELANKGLDYEEKQDGTWFLEPYWHQPKPTENFYYAEDGLHFVYNEYEIHCYAAGVFDLCIDWPLPESVTWRYKGAGTNDMPAVFED